MRTPSDGRALGSLAVAHFRQTNRVVVSSGDGAPQTVSLKPDGGALSGAGVPNGSPNELNGRMAVPSHSIVRKEKGPVPRYICQSGPFR